MTCHCIIVLQSMFVTWAGHTILLCMIMWTYSYTIACTCPLVDAMVHTCMIVCATVLNFLIFFIYWLALAWLSHFTMIMYTCDCLCTPLGFILRTRLVTFWQLWTCMFRSQNMKRSGPFRGGSGFPSGAGGSAVGHPWFISFWIACGIPFLAREHLSNFLSHPASRNTWTRSRDESRRRIYTKKISQHTR